MLLDHDMTTGGQLVAWDVQPKAGWDQFVAVRRTVFERLQMNSERHRLASEGFREEPHPPSR